MHTEPDDTDGELIDPEIVASVTEESLAEAEFERQREIDRAEMTPDELDREARRDGARDKMNELFLRGMRLVMQYRGNQILALHCYFAAHAQWDLIGCTSDVDIAVKLFADAKKKAAVTKCVQMFRDALALPTMPGRRGDDSRNKMTDARNSQTK